VARTVLFIDVHLHVNVDGAARIPSRVDRRELDQSGAVGHLNPCVAICKATTIRTWPQPWGNLVALLSDNGAYDEAAKLHRNRLLS